MNNQNNFLFLSVLDAMAVFESDYVGVQVKFSRIDNQFKLSYEVTIECREFLIGRLLDTEFNFKITDSDISILTQNKWKNISSSAKYISGDRVLSIAKKSQKIY